MRYFIFSLLCFSLSSSVVAQDSETQKEVDIDWTHPETIEPLLKGIGDFLDVELNTYRKKARDAYQSGKYEESAKYYLVLLRYDIHDAISIYNLACCYGLMGEEALAAKYLKRAVNAGYEDIAHIKKDPDFEKVRGKDMFDAAVDSLAQQIEKKQEGMGNVIYNDASSLLKCRVHLPENYAPGKSYPLVVGLHGYGSNPERFITLWKRFGKHEFIFVVPQAPYPFSVGKEVGFSWGVWSPNEVLLNKATLMSEKYIADVVDNLCMRYNVDDVYLLGFSQGCAFTYSTGIKNHHLFKGLICFGGWLDKEWLTESAIKEAKGLKVFIAHGKEDPMVKFETGVKAKEVLEDNGYDITFHDFEGGHSVPEEILKKTVKWMKE